MIQKIRNKRVGIMGGSFDPIHIGHLILAEHAYEQFQLDSVLILPTGNPPHKDNSIFAPTKHRLEMISLAIKDNDHFKLSLIEMKRDGVIYTYETLELLKEECPLTDYYFIMGADSLFDFEHWKEPSKVSRSCTILAATRKDMDKEEVDKQIEYLKNKYSGEIFYLNTPNVNISSRLLRENVKKDKTIKYFVLKEVEYYIKTNHLYKE